MDNPFKSFQIDGQGALGKLAQRAKTVQTLTMKVQDALPAPERDHVLAAAYHDDTLVVTTDSAAWTARIRFAQDELRKHLVAVGETTFVHLKVRVGHS